jgi:hypothetical protein
MRCLDAVHGDAPHKVILPPTRGKRLESQLMGYEIRSLCVKAHVV